ncbi:KH domain-containing protein [bacterium]|nr:MAG: KH domain-containing protein [bacterium]
MSYAPFVGELVKSLVSHPGDVEVDEEVNGNTRTFHVAVNGEDTGKVIGKNGKVINAIRLVVSGVATKDRERAFVKIVTND